MRKTFWTNIKKNASRSLLLIPLILAPMPLAAAGLAAFVLTERLSFKGLLIGAGLLFATLFLYRELPHAERLWHMGMALSCWLSALTLYFLPQKDESALHRRLWEVESKWLALKQQHEELLCTPDQNDERYLLALQDQEEAMQEISSLEGVVEHLLGELKRRSIPLPR